MLGLVSYESDEEEREILQIEAPSPIKSLPSITKDNGYLPDAEAEQKSFSLSTTPTIEEIKAPTIVTLPHGTPPSQLKHSATPFESIPIIGPTIGPSLPRDVSDSPHSNSPLSPYTLARQQIHSLTLPHTIPTIPPSPPGSPPPITSSKFSTFLTLKRRGTHFNEKLSRSSALRNPRLLEKLLGFVGLETNISADGGEWSGDQYFSNLTKELWNPCGFPDEAFYEKLRKKQEEIILKKQQEERTTVAFVSEKGSSGISAYNTIRDGPVIASSREFRDRDRRSAAERVMAGLDREEREKGKGRDYEKERDREREGNNEKDRDRSDGRKDRENLRERDKRRYNDRSRSNSRPRDRDRDRHSYRRPPAK